MKTVLFGRGFWKQILHKSLLRLIFDCGGALCGMSFRQLVLIGRPPLDIEDDLTDCL